MAENRGGSQGGDSGRVLESVRERVGQVAGERGESAQETLGKARQRIQQLANRLGDTEQVVANLTDVVRRYPIAMLAAGVGLGILLTMAFGRSARS